MAVETKPKIYTLSMWENLNSNVCLVWHYFLSKSVPPWSFYARGSVTKIWVLSTFFYMVSVIAVQRRHHRALRVHAGRVRRFSTCVSLFWMTDEVVIKTYRPLSQLILNLLCGKLWFQWEDFTACAMGFKEKWLKKGESRGMMALHWKYCCCPFFIVKLN